MDIIPIFDKNYSRESCILWAVRYPKNPKDEVARLFDLWNDINYLRNFFKENEKDLMRDFWQPMTVNQAISKTVREATLLEERLTEIENTAQENNLRLFNELFQPLSKNEYHCKPPQKVKGKMPNKNPFLRFYGLRLDEGQLLITGGGIKLTDTMQGSSYLKSELAKIETVKTYLKENQISYNE